MVLGSDWVRYFNATYFLFLFISYVWSCVCVCDRLSMQSCECALTRLFVQCISPSLNLSTHCAIAVWLERLVVPGHISPILMESDDSSVSVGEAMLVVARPRCRCGRQRVLAALWYPGEERPLCYECLNTIDLPGLPIEDRLLCLVLVLMWTRQRYRWGV